MEEWHADGNTVSSDRKDLPTGRRGLLPVIRYRKRADACHFSVTGHLCKPCAYPRRQCSRIRKCLINRGYINSDGTLPGIAEIRPAIKWRISSNRYLGRVRLPATPLLSGDCFWRAAVPDVRIRLAELRYAHSRDTSAAPAAGRRRAAAGCFIGCARADRQVTAGGTCPSHSFEFHLLRDIIALACMP